MTAADDRDRWGGPELPWLKQQLPSARRWRSIAADGEEADIFYNDGVNWPAGSGSRVHDCFAGYTGWIGGFNGSSQS